jgi:polyisoprenoid-binding protein YceI
VGASGETKGRGKMSTATTAVSAETWKIDPTHTSVDFSVKHMMITTVKGRFGEVDGVVTTTPEGDWSVDVRIAAASIDTRTGQRDDHLRSADFLDVATYPELTFRSTSVEGQFAEAGDRFKLAGELTIRGTTKPVVLDATYEGRGRDPWGGERLSFNATTRVDRREFGLVWNQGLETGGVLVGNDITINLDVQLVKQA